jgi:predicted DNA-binding transcriptional regulator AlpA
MSHPVDERVAAAQSGRFVPKASARRPDKIPAVPQRARGPPESGKLDRVRSLREFAAHVGISFKTLKRLLQAGKGPRLTQLSPNRVGVRDSHGQEWLEERAR